MQSKRPLTFQPYRRLFGGMMVEAMENLRILAGVLFWSMADLLLSICWIAVFGGLILAIVKGMKHG